MTKTKSHKINFVTQKTKQNKTKQQQKKKKNKTKKKNKQTNNTFIT